MIAPFALAAVLASQSAPLPAPTATPKAPLREIGHVGAASRFCSAFESHFNGAVRPMLEGDANIGYVGYALADIEPSFHALGGELRFYDDRVKMVRYIGELQKRIPLAQGEIDALRASAKLSPDADGAAQTVEIAAQLQKALDKQRQIAIDTQGVTQAMGDFAAATHKTELQPGIAGGYDDYEAHAPAAMRDVRSYLRWQTQLDRIGDAEGAAAGRADAVAGRCS